MSQRGGTMLTRRTLLRTGAVTLGGYAIAAEGWLDALCGMVQAPSECLRRLCAGREDRAYA